MIKIKKLLTSNNIFDYWLAVIVYIMMQFMMTWIRARYMLGEYHLLVIILLILESNGMLRQFIGEYVLNKCMFTISQQSYLSYVSVKFY